MYRLYLGFCFLWIFVGATGVAGCESPDGNLEPDTGTSRSDGTGDTGTGGMDADETQDSDQGGASDIDTSDLADRRDAPPPDASSGDAAGDVAADAEGDVTDVSGDLELSTAESRIAAGPDHTCLIMADTGEIQCWGEQDIDALTPPQDSGPYQQVSTIRGNTCAITEDRRAKCWGDNIHGQADAPSGSFVQAAAGGRHACALTPEGDIECWGLGSKPDVDEGTYDYDQAVPPSGKFKEISAGWNYTCAVTASKRVECWGSDQGGQASPPDGSYRSVTASDETTCAMTTDGAYECWGLHATDKLELPAASYRSIDFYRDYFGALTEDGDVHDSLETDAPYDYDIPQTKFREIAVGELHACGITEANEIECWGSNESGQLESP